MMQWHGTGWEALEESCMEGGDGQSGQLLTGKYREVANPANYFGIG